MSLKLRHILQRLEEIETDRNRNLATTLERENKWMDEGSTVRRMRVLIRYLMRTLDNIVDIGFDVLIRIVQFEVQDCFRKENVNEKCNPMLKDLRSRSNLFSALYDAFERDVTAGVFETKLCMRYREMRKDWIILERRCSSFDGLNVGNAREILLSNTIRWCRKLIHRADQTLEELLVMYSVVSPFEALLEQKVDKARRSNSPADFSVTVVVVEKNDNDDESNDVHDDFLPPGIFGNGSSSSISTSQDKEDLQSKPPGTLRPPSPETRGHIEIAKLRSKDPTPPLLIDAPPPALPDVVMSSSLPPELPEFDDIVTTSVPPALPDNVVEDAKNVIVDDDDDDEDDEMPSSSAARSKTLADLEDKLQRLTWTPEMPSQRVQEKQQVELSPSYELYDVNTIHAMRALFEKSNMYNLRDDDEDIDDVVSDGKDVLDDEVKVDEEEVEKEIKKENEEEEEDDDGQQQQQVPVVALTPKSRLEELARFDIEEFKEEEDEEEELMHAIHELADVVSDRMRREQEEEDGILSDDSLDDVDERFEMEVRRAQRSAEKNYASRYERDITVRKARIRAKLMGKKY